MADIRKLIKKLATQEAELTNIQFIAPCVKNGLVKTIFAGMIYIFESQPKKVLWMGNISTNK